MSRPLLLLAVASLVAVAFPSVFEDYRKHQAAESGPEMLDPPASVVTAAAPVPPPGRAVLPAGADGHFRASARLNNRPADVLVDTGATYVALNEATARRLGLVLPASAFRYKTKTANGEVPVALGTLDRVEIGNVMVRDVEVAVTKGDGLDTILLGMSFLKKLSRYEVAGGRLVLSR
ncbi:hypothetical protein GCM10011390_30800 [Aureimonas endophytica]|uniref:Aspartyl protease family protein n=1 Tax=Aureimonas endophytica TaxID=2027858 RepID=A0A916ZQS2_9HYPH|nr:TIGR02281 family clan AA aspartic protease [Aureimonas endophytica]GGE09549.1 hypothetical protein GCM10011390_30800 [Aureimonas endophytica]